MVVRPPQRWRSEALRVPVPHPVEGARQPYVSVRGQSPAASIGRPLVRRGWEWGAAWADDHQLAPGGREDPGDDRPSAAARVGLDPRDGGRGDARERRQLALAEAERMADRA